MVPFSTILIQFRKNIEVYKDNVNNKQVLEMKRLLFGSRPLPTVCHRYFIYHRMIGLLDRGDLAQW